MAGGKTDRLDRLFAQARTLTFEAGLTSGSERLQEVLTEIHRAPGDDKEKLRKKDQELVNSIDRFVQNLNNANWMPLGTVKTFIAVANLLLQIEAILWELKGEKGDPPKPERPKPPKPDQPPKP